MGVNGRTGVRLRGSDGGKEVTRSGSSRVFCAWSIAVTKPGGVSDSMGFEKTRLASRSHAGHAIDAGAVPTARVTSNAPCRSQRYS